ncbi:hypothetical protein [Klebsiella pneumoniae]|uniref:hypothetical protein n=1 Tax=Klebsiella pneumoniae TaxID=573 RepID=UPI003F6DCEAC
MTKSTITRERAQQIFLGNGPEPSASEERELARMALAAMDSSESVELPIDYLQGHKDGLEWAAQLAEANHPETGDWVYDDPIELSKAIRKGPDMPPAQSVADSEPVIVVGDDGGDALSYRRLIQSFEPGTKLYRHAQPAPVVPNGLRLALSNAGIAAPESDEMLAATCEKHIQALVTWVKDRKPFQSAPVVPSFEEWLSAANRKPLGWVKDAMREAYDACRAAMLQHQPQNAQQNIPENIPGGLVEAVNNLLNNDGSRGCYDAMECGTAREKIELWLAQRQRWEEQRKANLYAGNSPVIPNGYVMVPKEPTPEILATITEAIRAMRGSAATYARVLAAAPQEVK